MVWGTVEYLIFFGKEGRYIGLNVAHDLSSLLARFVDYGVARLTVNGSKMYPNPSPARGANGSGIAAILEHF